MFTSSRCCGSSTLDFPLYNDVFDEDNGHSVHSDLGSHEESESSSSTSTDDDAASEFSHAQRKKRLEEDNYCAPNGTYVWCLPRDYNQEKHPFTCKSSINIEVIFKRFLLGFCISSIFVP